MAETVSCTCPPCPANKGRECDCGRFWFEPPSHTLKGGRVINIGAPHCGVHDPKP